MRADSVAMSLQLWQPIDLAVASVDAIVAVPFAQTLTHVDHHRLMSDVVFAVVVVALVVVLAIA